MKSYLAVITPVREATGDDLPHPDQGLPEPGPGGGGGGEEGPPVYIDNTLPGPGSAGGEHPDNTLPPFPSHPIVIPPDLEIPPEVEEGLRKFEVKTGWTEEQGWFVVLVPKEGTLVPTPSGGKK